MKLNRRGDTIVEVLIVTAVLALVIGSSYAIASKGLRGMRQAQERGEALKIAEGQVETIKALVATGTQDDAIFDTNTVYCLDGSTNKPVRLKDGYPNTVIQPLTADDFNAYPGACVNGFYHTAVDVDQVSSNGDLKVYQFNVFIRWDSLSNIGRDQIEVNYRVLKEN